MEVHNKATALERQLWRGNNSVGAPVSLRPAVCLSALGNINPPLWAGSGRVPAVPQEEQRGGSEGGGEAPSVPGREALWPRPVHHTPHEQGALELHRRLYLSVLSFCPPPPSAPVGAWSCSRFLHCGRNRPINEVALNHWRRWLLTHTCVAGLARDAALDNLVTVPRQSAMVIYDQGQ